MKKIKMLAVMLAGLMLGLNNVCAMEETDKARGFFELGRSVLRLDIMDIVENITPTVWNMRKSLTADCTEIKTSAIALVNFATGYASRIAQDYVVMPSFSVVTALGDYVPAPIMNMTNHGYKIGSLVYLMVTQPDEVRAKLGKTD